MQKFLMNNMLFDTIEQAQKFYVFQKIVISKSLFIVRNGTQEYRFENEEEADNFLKERNEQVETYEIIPIEVVENPRNLENLLENNLNFGQTLIRTFLLDNYNLPQSFSVEQSAELMKKFEVLIKLSQLGDIKSVATLLPNVEIDEIFTGERKEKYISMVSNYLATLS